MESKTRKTEWKLNQEKTEKKLKQQICHLNDFLSFLSNI